jgi:hypothetical protein
MAVIFHASPSSGNDRDGRIVRGRCSLDLFRADELGIGAAWTLHLGNLARLGKIRCAYPRTFIVGFFHFGIGWAAGWWNMAFPTFVVRPFRFHASLGGWRVALQICGKCCFAPITCIHHDQVGRGAVFVEGRQAVYGIDERRFAVVRREIGRTGDLWARKRTTRKINGGEYNARNRDSDR